MVLRLSEEMLAEIEAKAKEATQGEWTFVPEKSSGFVIADSTNPTIPDKDVVATPAYSDRSHEMDAANMAHIASVGPSVTLSMVEEIRSLRFAVKSYEDDRIAMATTRPRPTRFRGPR